MRAQPLVALPVALLCVHQTLTHQNRSWRQARDATTEAHLSELRLLYWRDQIKQLYQGHVPTTPVTRALAKLLHVRALCPSLHPLSLHANVVERLVPTPCYAAAA